MTEWEVDQRLADALDHVATLVTMSFEPSERDILGYVEEITDAQVATDVCVVLSLSLAGMVELVAENLGCSPTELWQEYCLKEQRRRAIIPDQTGE